MTTTQTTSIRTIPITLSTQAKVVAEKRYFLKNDDNEIIEVAKKWGCNVPFVRPAELAQDDTAVIELVLHAIQELPDYQYMVLLQPTSPFRSVADIDKCIERCSQNNANACVSVTTPQKHPYWMYVVDDHYQMHPLIDIDVKKRELRRQDLPVVYTLNGAIYVAKCKWLLEFKSFVTEDTLAYPMPEDRSLDIDTELDLALMKYIIQRPGN